MYNHVLTCASVYFTKCKMLLDKTRAISTIGHRMFCFGNVTFIWSHLICLSFICSWWVSFFKKRPINKCSLCPRDLSIPCKRTNMYSTLPLFQVSNKGKMHIHNGLCLYWALPVWCTTKNVFFLLVYPPGVSDKQRVSNINSSQIYSHTAASSWGGCRCCCCCSCWASWRVSVNSVTFSLFTAVLSFIWH